MAPFSSLLFLLFVLCARADDASDVIVLTTENFHEVVKQHPLIMVEFYAPWCGHCKHLAPEYEKAATELKQTGIPLAKVDADAEINRDLASEFGVRGFPTIKIFRNGEFSSDFQGDRTSAAIVSFMKKQSLPAISSLNNLDEANAFSTSDRVVIVGFFNNRDSSEYEQFKVVAEKSRDNFVFGEVISNAAVNKAFEVSSAPTVVLFKKFDEGKNVLSGAEAFKDLNSFINKHSVPLIDEVGPQNYKSYVDSGLPLCYLFVDLQKEGQLEDYLSRVRPHAVQTKGKLNWVYINWSKYARHSERLGLSGKTVPALGIENLETGAHYAFDETAEITEKSVGEWVTKFVNGELAPTIKSQDPPADNSAPVKVVVAKTFDDIVLDSTKDVLVEFYAPWCGHCKQLAPIYDEVGKTFQGVNSVVIAKIDATSNDVDPKYGIRGFPTIKFFPANNKLSPIDFEGDRTKEDFVDFVKEHASIQFNKDEL